MWSVRPVRPVSPMRHTHKIVRTKTKALMGRSIGGGVDFPVGARSPISPADGDSGASWCVEVYRVGADGRAGRAEVAPGAHDGWVSPGDHSNGAGATFARRADVACEDGA